MKRRIALGVAALAVAAAIRQIRNSVEYSELTRYWDQRFGGEVPERGALDPKLAELIDKLYFYKLEVDRRQQETWEMYG